MSDVTVRLVSGKFDGGGEGFRTKGDKFDVTEATAAEHDELEPVSRDESGGSDASDENADTDAPFDPGEHTVDELRDEIDGVSDDGRQALATAERDGKDRDTAIDILEP